MGFGYSSQETNLFTSYFAPIFFVVLYVVYKFWKKTKWRSVEEADITTGKQEIDDEEEAEIAELMSKPQRKGKIWKILYKISDFCFN